MSNNQLKHFETLNIKYNKYYYSNASMFWRRRNIFDFFLKYIDFNNKTIAEFCCGDGNNSKFLKQNFNPQYLWGCDISPTAVDNFKKTTGFNADVIDLTIDHKFTPKFDIAMIMGGLHHCIKNLDVAISNIHSSLNKNGILCVYEPYCDSIMNKIRNTWYKTDSYFDEENERAIDINDITKNGFIQTKVKYIGGLGYYFISQAMIFRIPLFVQSVLSRPLTYADLITDKLLPKKLSASFAGVFIKS